LNARLFILLLIASLLAGCSAHQLRREFYRGEIRYLHTQAEKDYLAGDYVAAGHLYQQILELDPGDEPARIQMAHLALARGEATQAVKAYLDIVKDNPGKRGMIEPYLAYAMTMPAKAEALDVQATKAPEILPGRHGRPDTQDDARPATGTDPVASSLKELRRRLTLVPGSGSGPLGRFILELGDILPWVAAHQRVLGPAQQSVSRELLALYGQGRLADCAICLEFASLWYGAQARGPQLDVMTGALANASLDPKARGEIAYLLGLAYERAGARAKAVHIYLENQADPRVRKRLLRFSGRSNIDR